MHTFRTLQQEVEAINSEFVYEGDDTAMWYFLFRAVDDFATNHHRYPKPEDWETLKALVDGIVGKSGIEDYRVREDFIKEAYSLLTAAAEAKTHSW